MWDNGRSIKIDVYFLIIQVLRILHKKTAFSHMLGKATRLCELFATVPTFELSFSSVDRHVLI